MTNRFLLKKLNEILRRIGEIEEKLDKWMMPTTISSWTTDKENFSPTIDYIPPYWSFNNHMLSAGMCPCSKFGDSEVYWVGNDTGDLCVFGPDRVIGQAMENGELIEEYQLDFKSCLLTTALPYSEYIYLTREEAEAKCEELKEEQKQRNSKKE